MSSTDVLIVGAGPTGLVLAHRLLKHGTRFRIVDRASGPGQASRAMVVQARTLEFYAQLGFADDVVARGIVMERMHFREEDSEVGVVTFAEAGEGLTPYPYVLCFPQDDHERFLLERLEEGGVCVEWNTELTSLEQDGEGVTASLRGPGGAETCEAAYLVGCDGAHTVVRPQVGIGFPGGTYHQLFYVADVRLDRPVSPDGSVNLGPRSLVVMLPVRSTGMWRLIGIVPEELGERHDLTFADVRATAEALAGVTVVEANWFSTYRVHHRVADHFRSGRVFLAGDAGHLHSPAGGQGMNTGIGDAVNLSWKLADVLAGRAAPTLLDSFEPERIAFARKLVETTDRAFEGMVGEGWTSRVLRDWILPHLLPSLTRFETVRRAMFETVSQTRINYRDGPLSEGAAGKVHGGDRFPWTGDNGAALAATDWRVHVYDAVRERFGDAARALGLRVELVDWSEGAEKAGIARDAAYLIRPDGHVAFASAGQDPDALTAYAARIGLTQPSAG